MKRWLKIVWYVAEGPVKGLAQMAIAIALCSAVVAPLMFYMSDSETPGVLEVLAFGTLVLGALFAMWLVGDMVWRLEVAPALAEARKEYPPPLEVSSEPGDLSEVKGGGLEVVDG